MPRKVQKTVSLDLDTVERLEEEENQSMTVQKALHDYWAESEGE